MFVVIELIIFTLTLIVISSGFLDGILSWPQYIKAGVWSYGLASSLLILYLYRKFPAVIKNFQILFVILIINTGIIHAAFPGLIGDRPFFITSAMYLIPVLLYASTGSLVHWLTCQFFVLLSEFLPILINSVYERSRIPDSYDPAETFMNILPLNLFVLGAGMFTALASKINTSNTSKANPQKGADLKKAGRYNEEENEEVNTVTASLDNVHHTQVIKIDHLRKGDQGIFEYGDLLSQITFFMQRNFKAYSALGFIYDENSNSLKLNSFESKCKASIIKDLEITPKDGILGQIIQEGKSFISGDMTYYNQDLKYYADPQMILSFIAVPIISETNRLRGALVLDNRNKNAFRNTHKTLLKRFSAIAADLISNVERRIYQERAAKHFKLLSEAGQAFMKAETPGEVIETLFSTFTKIRPEDRIVSIVYDVYTKTGKISKISGSSNLLKPGMSLPVNTGLYAQVLKNRAPMNIADYSSEEYSNTFRLHPNDPEDVDIRSLYILPLNPMFENNINILGIESSIPEAFQGEFGRNIVTLARNASLAYEKVLLYKRMEEQATTDGLTRLINHRTFQQKLSAEINRIKRYSGHLSLLLMDIDHFKNFNDTYGHQIGDEVLKYISRTLLKTTRDNDICARYGGEEFVVILPETDTEGAKQIAERIRESIEKGNIKINNEQLGVTVSIGLATYNRHCSSKSQLIECADKAMYFSKENGRNCVTVYNPGIE